jgi:hypothetical protein
MECVSYRKHDSAKGGEGNEQNPLSQNFHTLAPRSVIVGYHLTPRGGFERKGKPLAADAVEELNSALEEVKEAEARLLDKQKEQAK